MLHVRAATRRMTTPVQSCKDDPGYTIDAPAPSLNTLRLRITSSQPVCAADIRLEGESIVTAGVRYRPNRCSAVYAGVLCSAIGRPLLDMFLSSDVLMALLWLRQGRS